MSRILFVLGSLVLMAVTLAQAQDKWPGRVQNPQEQCKERKPDYYAAVCKVQNDADICKNLMCTAMRGDQPIAEKTGPALDGTWCGKNMICDNGTCVQDPELGDGTGSPSYDQPEYLIEDCRAEAVL